MAFVTPTEQDIDIALRTLLLSVCPGIEIVKGQINRVGEPPGTDFIVFTDLNRVRLATNIDDSADVRFEASIANGTMTVTNVDFGTLSAGALVWGSGTATGTVIVRQISGAAGGTGTYSVTPLQVISNEVMACGAKTILVETEVTYQVDVYGPNAANNAQIVQTVFRDEYAFAFIQDIYLTISPLYADDPKQIPAIYGEAQYEDRWVIQAALQADQTVSLPQQYADIVTVIPESVDVVFPP